MKRKIEIACIIDDDDIYVYGVKKLIQIKQLCNHLMVFSNGREALNHLKPILNIPELLPEVIFLDINMPVMNGWQFLEEFSNLNVQQVKDITIYMISSSLDPRDMDRAKAIESISKYIVKPVTLDMLVEVFGSES